MAENEVPHDQGAADALARVEVRRQAEREDREERAYGTFALEELRQEVGDADFHQGQRVLEQHIASLPADRRERITEGRTKDGTRFVHDPSTLKALVNQALGPAPRTRQEAQATVEAARARMRSDRAGWFADDRAQMNYLRALRALGNN